MDKAGYRKRERVATAIAAVLHVIGIIGIFYFDREWFIGATPIILVASLLLIFWTQRNRNLHFFLFMFIIFIAGFAVEAAGVNKAWLFGNYSYGEALGPSFLNVPLVIGVNWCIIIYCCGITIQRLFIKVMQLVSRGPGTRSILVKKSVLIMDGALLALLFDWLMEPAAIRMGLWSWAGAVPWYNYVCWFFLSAGGLLLFHQFAFEKRNKFAVNLLLIQLMFFLLIRSFLE